MQLTRRSHISWRFYRRSREPAKRASLAASAPELTVRHCNAVHPRGIGVKREEQDGHGLEEAEAAEDLGFQEKEHLGRIVE